MGAFVGGLPSFAWVLGQKRAEHRALGPEDVNDVGHSVKEAVEYAKADGRSESGVEGVTLDTSGVPNIWAPRKLQIPSFPAEEATMSNGKVATMGSQHAEGTRGWSLARKSDSLVAFVEVNPSQEGSWMCPFFALSGVG